VRAAPLPSGDLVSEDFDRLPDPPWFFQSRLVKDSLLYARAVWECTVRPRAFARTWVTGEASWLNPLEMMAISVGLLSVTDRLLVGEAHGAVLTTIWGSLAPYVKYTLAGAVAYPLLRRRGGARGVSSTIAMAVFAGAGPGCLSRAFVLLGRAFGWWNVTFLQTHVRVSLALMLLSWVAAAPFFVALAGMLGGLHRRGWFQTVAVVLVAMLASSLVLTPIGIALKIPEFSSLLGTPTGGGGSR